MRFLFTFLIAAFITIPALASELESEIKQGCKDAWPADYSMQKYCIEQEAEAADKLYELSQKYPKGTEERLIIARCLKKWSEADSNGKTYSMTVYCTDKQLSAYNSLKE